MKTITKAINFVKTKTILELSLILYCAILTALFIVGAYQIIYTLIFDQTGVVGGFGV